MTALVVLPGLDGTTEMLPAFIAAARPAFTSVAAIAYPRDQVLGYAELEAFARSALPTRVPFVLLGESFSGPVALAIAADPPPGLVGLVLSTTFSQSPVPWLSPFAALARFAPVRGVPVPVLSWWLLGRWATPELESLLRAALSSVAPAVLRSRAASALRANATARLGAIPVPVLCLRATEDRLLSPVASARILAAVPRVSVVDIAGPHLLLQAAPEACAQAVAEFSARL
jgi:pimeloyl-[acyl-carrier protein] methyl ester esterase